MDGESLCSYNFWLILKDHQRYPNLEYEFELVWVTFPVKFFENFLVVLYWFVNFNLGYWIFWLEVAGLRDFLFEMWLLDISWKITRSNLFCWILVTLVPYYPKFS
ncbi:hypothetical protein ACSBR2_000118 [Camellia fascicularis]